MTDAAATSRRYRKVKGVCALVVSGATLLAFVSPVRADPALGGFRASTWASAARSSYTMGTSLVSDIFDTPGPIAQATLDDLGGASFASLPYPGGTTANYAQFTNLVVPAPLPGYPFWAVADQNSPETAVADPTNSYGLHAKVSATSALGEAKLRPAAGESAAAGSIVTSTVEATGDRVVARAQSVTDGLDLGVLRIAAIHSTSVTTYTAGDQPRTETALTLDGGRVGDLTFTFGPGGLKVQQNNVALPLAEGLGQLNKALEPAQLSVRFLSSEPIQGGARSQSFEVRNVHRDLTSPNANGTVALRFGEVISAVVAEGTAPALDTGAPTSSTDTSAADAGEPVPPSSAVHGPATASDVSAGRSVAGTFPGGFFASPTGLPAASDGGALPLAEAQSGGSTETAAAPAAPLVMPVAPAASRPATPILTASGGRLYGTVAVSILVLVLLSVLWRRGVQQ